MHPFGLKLDTRSSGLWGDSKFMTISETLVHLSKGLRLNLKKIINSTFLFITT